MTLATLTRPIPALPQDPLEGVQLRQVGPGWEVLLMSEPLARLVTPVLAGRPARVAPLGWVFAHAGQRGIFLPEQSDDPAWPPGTTYLKSGAKVTLPSFSQRWTEHDGTSGWVSLDGSPLSRPLLLHPVLTALAAAQPRATTALESRS
ncbi:hypothetical protein ACFY2H_30875 [Streptomyces griseofuscus]|uniref:hypothetical protein n=1 Tax=Streptomyces griseofuscus TaxID=146922 RepID=UPI0036B120F5